MKKIYEEIATRLLAIQNCIASKNDEWRSKHEEIINQIMLNAPSGSGIDCGTKFDYEKSTKDKLVFTFDFHFMNDDGVYYGWQSYKLFVTGSLLGLNLEFKGTNKDEIFDYFHDVYYNWLNSEYIEI